MTLLECHKSREEGKEGEREERGRENERERERRERGGGEKETAYEREGWRGRA